VKTGAVAEPRSAAGARDAAGRAAAPARGAGSHDDTTNLLGAAGSRVGATDPRGAAGSRAGATDPRGATDSRAGGASAGVRHTGGATPVAASAPALHRQWDFGDLPATREVERNRLRLVVYPAVEDRGAGVALIEARNAQSAEAISRAGIVRLAMLDLPQQAKYVNKRMVDDRDLILLSRGLPLKQSLADALTQRAFRECFLPAEVPLPRTTREFSELLESRRSQLSDVADRLAGIVTSTLKEWRAARAAVAGLPSGLFIDVVTEVNAQMSVLLPPDFIEATSRPWLDYLPRYLKALTRRIERLPPNVRRDTELSAKVKPFATALRTLMAEPALSGARSELEDLRWMIEEFRVSLFAQELKTMVRVSEKRLDEQLRLARDAQR
jgi:ATP-dependent helicase HrpA